MGFWNAMQTGFDADPAEEDTDRPMRPKQGAYGSPGFNNARTLLGERGVAVGRSAQAANPGAQKVRWRDIAQAAGMEDFRGAKKDERFRDLQDAFYGHADSGGVVDPERQRLKTNMANYYTTGAGAGVGGGAGGAGGGGGYGGGAGGGLGLEGEVEKLLLSGVRGQGGPFTEDVRNAMRAEAKADTSGQVRAANRSANIAAVRSGNYYGGAGAETLAENERAGNEALGAQQRQIDYQGRMQNFQAQMDARDRALEKLQKEKENAIAGARNDIDARRVANEYDAAMEGIKVQREKIAADAKSADSAARAEMASGRAWREHELNKLNLQRDWDVQDWQERELPFQLAEYGG